MNWYTNIKKYFNDGFWDKQMVQNAVTKGKITQEQCDEIIKEN